MSDGVYPVNPNVVTSWRFGNQVEDGILVDQQASDDVVGDIPSPC